MDSPGYLRNKITAVIKSEVKELSEKVDNNAKEIVDINTIVFLRSVQNNDSCTIQFIPRSQIIKFTYTKLLLLIRE